MNIKKRWISLVLALALLLTGCEKFSIPTNANTAFRNFTFDLFQQEVASNTINLHYSLQEPEKYGITNPPITLGSFDVNVQSALASVENWSVALQKFPYQSLSRENQLTYDILVQYFATLSKDISFYLYEEPLSPLTGIHAQLPVLLAEYQFSKKSDVETYLSLLETVPDYFSSLIRFEQQKAASNLFMSHDAAETVIQQCNDFISMGDQNYLLSTFEDRISSVPKLSTKEKQQYIAENKNAIDTHVIPSYKNLASALTSLKQANTIAQGLCYFPDGTEYYTHLVLRETGSTRSISELKLLIQSQITKDLFDAQQLLSENPSLTEETISSSDTPEHILETLEEKITTTFPDAASVDVQVKYVPKALQEHLSPAFYLIPAIDHYKENTIYINQLYAFDNLYLFTTLAHEGYPGHLYQTTYFSSTNPDPIRSLISCAGYVEGWATYAEMCSYSISSLSKPYASLLQKNNSFILGLYASADIGIHYDGWNLEETISFFESYGIQDETTVTEIFQHIASDPANYLTYYVGYLEMLELKKEAMQKHGAAFSQKDFHQKVLEIGPAPFDIIRKYLD